MNVGDVAERTRRVEAEDIERFTAMTGDRNPLHYDLEAATRSRFGGIIVQGGVTTGLLNALVAEDLPGPGSVFLNVNWDFRAPTRPGDVITARGEITSVHPTKPVCTMHTTITNQSGEVLVDGSVVVYREPLS
jgi:acyl dehydratase